MMLGGVQFQRVLLLLVIYLVLSIYYVTATSERVWLLLNQNNCMSSNNDCQLNMEFNFCQPNNIVMRLQICVAVVRNVTIRNSEYIDLPKVLNVGSNIYSLTITDSSINNVKLFSLHFHIKDLTLNNNTIREFRNNGELVNLQRLDLKDNMLTTFSCVSTELTYLDLSNNKIQNPMTINIAVNSSIYLSNAFNHDYSMKQIDLTNHLNVLDISRNNLSTLNIISNVDSVQEINLSHNNLSQLNGLQKLITSGRLRIIELEDNKFLCSLSLLKIWLDLVISNIFSFNDDIVCFSNSTETTVKRYANTMFQSTVPQFSQCQVNYTGMNLDINCEATQLMNYFTIQININKKIDSTELYNVLIKGSRLNSDLQSVTKNVSNNNINSNNNKSISFLINLTTVYNNNAIIVISSFLLLYILLTIYPVYWFIKTFYHNRQRIKRGQKTVSLASVMEKNKQSMELEEIEIDNLNYMDSESKEIKVKTPSEYVESDIGIGSTNCDKPEEYLYMTSDCSSSHVRVNSDVYMEL